MSVSSFPQSAVVPRSHNGNISMPTFRMWNADGTWFKEGHRVDPDVEVKDNPSQLARRIDPQLERGM